MTNTVKMGDFVELDYTGKLEDGSVFDTTIEAVAKNNQMGQEHHAHAYKPLKICVGKGHLLKGLDNKLEGKEIGKTYSLRLVPEEAFGKKSPQYIQLIATSKFTKDKIMPFPGLQVNVDGLMGVVKTVTGGRTIVDFNHPLAGKSLDYEVTVRKIIVDDAEKLSALIELIGLKAVSKVENGSAQITSEQEIPKEFADKFSDDIKEAIPSIGNVSYSVQGAKSLSTGQ